MICDFKTGRVVKQMTGNSNNLLWWFHYFLCVGISSTKVDCSPSLPCLPGRFFHSLLFAPDAWEAHSFPAHGYWCSCHPSLMLRECHGILALEYGQLHSIASSLPKSPSNNHPGDCEQAPHKSRVSPMDPLDPKKKPMALTLLSGHYVLIELEILLEKTFGQ